MQPEVMADQTRRRVLQGTGVALTAGLAGCSSDSSSGSSDGSSGDGADGGSSGADYEPVSFLETPGETPGDTEEMWEPFREHVRSTVPDAPFNVDFADNTSAIGQALI